MDDLQAQFWSKQLTKWVLLSNTILAAGSMQLKLSRIFFGKVVSVPSILMLFTKDLLVIHKVLFSMRFCVILWQSSNIFPIMFHAKTFPCHSSQCYHCLLYLPLFGRVYKHKGMNCVQFNVSISFRFFVSHWKWNCWLWIDHQIISSENKFHCLGSTWKVWSFYGKNV